MTKVETRCAPSVLETVWLVLIALLVGMDLVIGLAVLALAYTDFGLYLSGCWLTAD